MMIKTLFTELQTRLKDEVTGLKWIDFDKGQLDFFDMRPAISFPAALLTIEILDTKDYNQNLTMQKEEYMVTVRVVSDFTGNTNQVTPTVAMDQSLGYLDLCESIHNKLQGWRASITNKMTRKQMRDERRTDGYKAVQMVYRTSLSKF